MEKSKYKVTIADFSNFCSQLDKNDTYEQRWYNISEYCKQNGIEDLLQFLADEWNNLK